MCPDSLLFLFQDQIQVNTIALLFKFMVFMFSYSKIIVIYTSDPMGLIQIYLYLSLLH
jgi:hypothetical protein